MGGVFIYHNLKGGDTLSAASHRAGFFYFTTKEVFRWLTIKRIFPTLGQRDEAPQLGKGRRHSSLPLVQDQPAPAKAEAPVVRGRRPL